jgi:MFS transporter, SP family, solute carrier family 2 (facilitated glucose transporter), member 3
MHVCLKKQNDFLSSCCCSYSNSFFQGVIREPLVGTTIVGIVNVMATYGSLLVMESTNRRTLLLVSSAGMMVCSVVLILALVGYFNNNNNSVALVAVTFYVVLFELGLGPIPWLMVPELFSPPYVAAAMSAATQVNWVTSFLVSLSFPFLQQTLGGYSFVPFALCLVLTFLYTWFLLPETRGKTPHEVYLGLELAGGKVDRQRQRFLHTAE